MPDKLIDRREPGFFIVDNELLDVYGERIGAYGIAVYVYLVRCASNKAMAFPAYRTMVKKLGISKPKLISTIRDLETIGLLTIHKRFDEGGRPKSNLYEIANLKRAVAPSETSAPEIYGKPDLPNGQCDLPHGQPDLPNGKRGLPQGQCDLPIDGKRGLPQAPISGKCGLPKEDNIYTQLEKESDPIIQDRPAPQPVTPPPPTAVAPVLPISQPEPPTPITPLSPVPVMHSEDSPAGAAGHRTAGQRTGDVCMDAALARFEGTWGRRNEQQVVDGLTRQVEALGLTRDGFRLLVDEFLRKYGKLEMASLQTETATKALAKAQDIVLSICGIDRRFRSVAGLNTIFASWSANDYRGASLPTGEQLLEHAGKMKAGAVTCERKGGTHANSSGGAQQPVAPVKQAPSPRAVFIPVDPARTPF